jgi:hypothetical protein
MTTPTTDPAIAHRRRRAPRARWLLAVLAGLALIAAACSSGGGSSVASLPGHSGGSSSAPSGFEAQRDSSLVSFAHCMQAHGVQMSNPYHRAGATGLTVDLPPHTAATQAGYDACGHFIAAIAQAKAAAAASQIAADLPALTDYARCMRAHDINMLDPTPQGALNLGDVPGMTDDFGRYSPQFRAADAACRHYLPANIRAHDNGTGA